MAFKGPESLSEQIANYLAERIIEGDMKAGERVQEARVVDELQVSRGPVREALIILEGWHLVTILPRRGAIVAELTEARVHSLYDVYVTLLTMLATQVAIKWTDETKEDLLNQALSMQAMAEKGTGKEFIVSAFELMHAASLLVGNEYLAQMLRELQPPIHRTYALSIRHSPSEKERARDFFAHLISAVLARNTEVLPEMLESYGKHQRELVLSAMAVGH